MKINLKCLNIRARKRADVLCFLPSSNYGTIHSKWDICDVRLYAKRDLKHGETCASKGTKVVLFLVAEEVHAQNGILDDDAQHNCHGTQHWCLCVLVCICVCDRAYYSIFFFVIHKIQKKGFSWEKMQTLILSFLSYV